MKNVIFLKDIMTCKDPKQCGAFHCWKCEKHISLKDAPYCEKCKELMKGQTKLI